MLGEYVLFVVLVEDMYVLRMLVCIDLGWVSVGM